MKMKMSGAVMRLLEMVEVKMSVWAERARVSHGIATVRVSGYAVSVGGLTVAPLGLLAYIGQDAAVDVEDVAVDEV